MKNQLKMETATFYKKNNANVVFNVHCEVNVFSYVGFQRLLNLQAV